MAWASYSVAEMLAQRKLFRANVCHQLMYATKLMYATIGNEVRVASATFSTLKRKANVRLSALTSSTR